ncbi:MAG TPA: hypothetical protein VLH35_02195 [Candidatus Acidoferrales bacterium]|nr:hypothetical protein [Candidatus Acidoferrales bacterium]
MERDRNLKILYQNTRHNQTAIAVKPESKKQRLNLITTYQQRIANADAITDVATSPVRLMMSIEHNPSSRPNK